MNTKELTIEARDLQKLLGAASGDSALLYLYLRGEGDPEAAAKTLHMSQSRVDCATATLRQLGLWQVERKKYCVGERPSYTESDVLDAKGRDTAFQSLYEELERSMGRTLTVEELKIVLGFVRYLGLEPAVVHMLVVYCKERARQRGSLRNPSLRTIEKEAYAWAEQGIDTVEEASAYIARQNIRHSQLGRLMQLLQIRGRNLTPAEEKYANRWLEWGFDEELLSEAYQRTCINTGTMNWKYMNTILTRWQEAGLKTLQQVKDGDKKKASMPKGASGKLGDAEMEAMRKMLQEV